MEPQVQLFLSLQASVTCMLVGSACMLPYLLVDLA